MGLDIEAATSNYKHESTSEDLPREFVAAASSAAFRTSVSAVLYIIDVPHVSFRNLVNSSYATLTVTSLGHVTQVLSPAFDADTIFYEVNVTSLTYMVNACASNEEGATGLEVDKKRSRHLHPCSTDPAYHENKELVSARDTTTTTYVVHAFFRPVPCDCYAGTAVILSMAPVGVTQSSTDPVAKPIVLECALPQQENVRHGIQLKLMCKEIFGGPGCNVQSCPHCHVLERKRRPQL